MSPPPLRLCALALLALACQVRLGAPVPEPKLAQLERVELGQEAADAYLADLGRVLAVSQRLRVAGTELCGHATAPVLGAEVVQRLFDDDLGAFYEALFAKLGVGDDPTVVAIAPGSPAERAGLVLGDRILSVGDRRLRRARELPELLRAGRGSAPALQVGRGAEVLDVTLPLELGCDATLRLSFEPAINTGKARGKGQGYVTALLLRYVRDDDELAAALSHEIAHLVLGGRAGGYPDRELEADRLALAIATRAGYDPAAALRFWERLAVDKPWLITRNLEWYVDRREPPHGRLAERLVALRAALAAWPRTAP